VAASHHIHEEVVMTPVELSCRGRVLADIAGWSTEFAHHSANFARLLADTSQDPGGLALATAALRMYSALAAIEELHDDLVRVSTAGLQEG
jgi:hypothetical protein